MSNVAVSVEGLKQATEALAGIRNGMRDAMVGAINDTSKKQRTKISSDIRDRINIKKRDIDQKITIVRAGKTNVRGSILLKESERLSLRYFGANQTAKGVTYRISKKGKRAFIAGAFQGPRPGVMKASWKGNVFKRVGKSRLPIEKLMGASPWGAFTKADLEQPTITETNALLETNLGRRVNYLLLKHAGKI